WPINKGFVKVRFTGNNQLFEQNVTFQFASNGWLKLSIKGSTLELQLFNRKLGHLIASKCREPLRTNPSQCLMSLSPHHQAFKKVFCEGKNSLCRKPFYFMCNEV